MCEMNHSQYTQRHYSPSFIMYTVTRDNKRHSSFTIHTVTLNAQWHSLFHNIHSDIRMGWLWLVGSLKIQVSFAEYNLFYRALLQNRPIFLGSLLIVAASQNKTHNDTHYTVTLALSQHTQRRSSLTTYTVTHRYTVTMHAVTFVWGGDN